MNILIVDDHLFIHEFLGGVLRAVFGEAVVHFAASLAQALEKAACAPELDLVLLDLCLPDCKGIETLAKFRGVHPRPRVVVFSAMEEAPDVLNALKAGAAGYLPKTSAPSVIVAALRLVAAGGVYVPPQAITPCGEGERRPREVALTSRQLDVLRLIIKGFANKQIARRLRIAEDTVKQHARGAYAVLGVSSRTQAVSEAARRGIRID